ncbi:hypothetical protein DPEC_G00304310 [Dallia pectoralis]|uniref:Uncharacterized protein n=1 Tax=Dallia pectoralis TaxID=75939 RepID=A0ACC2FDR7_DALPE|nr:hypothetical protein DPEC_G00304310 [Dallia pectoralis]
MVTYPVHGPFVVSLVHFLPRAGATVILTVTVSLAAFLLAVTAVLYFPVDTDLMTLPPAVAPLVHSPLAVPTLVCSSVAKPSEILDNHRHPRAHPVLSEPRLRCNARVRKREVWYRSSQLTTPPVPVFGRPEVHVLIFLTPGAQSLEL